CGTAAARTSAIFRGAPLLMTIGMIHLEVLAKLTRFRPTFIVALSMAKPRRGDTLELAIEDLAFGGEGVGRADGYVIFVRGGLPGDRLRVRLVEARGRFGRATIDEVLVASPDRVQAPCPYFGQCGGCRLQHLAYPAQLAFKEKQVRDCLQRLGGLGAFELRPILPAPEPYGYRNKMEFTITSRAGPAHLSQATHGGRGLADPAHLSQATHGGRGLVDPGHLSQATHGGRGLVDPAHLSQATHGGRGLVDPAPTVVGLHQADRYDVVLDIERCLLQSEAMNDLLDAFRREIRARALSVYEADAGLLRFVSLREGHRTGEAMVNIVATTPDVEALAPLAAELARRVPATASVVLNVNAKKASVAVGTEEHLLLGRDHIRASLGGLSFQVSANSFFQTNAAQAERLFAVVDEACSLSGGETVLDLGAIVAGGYRLEWVQPVDMFPQTPHIEAVARLRRAP